MSRYRVLESEPGRRVAGVLVLLAILAIGVLRSSAGSRLDSFTVDEPWHIVAGTSDARNGNFNLNPEHPPLIKLWVGSAMPEDFRLEPHKELSEKAQEREWVEKTMFVDNDARRAQARARAAMFSPTTMSMFAAHRTTRILPASPIPTDRAISARSKCKTTRIVFLSIRSAIRSCLPIEKPASHRIPDQSGSHKSDRITIA